MCYRILDMVRVTGTLKNFGDKRYINASHIRKLDTDDGPQELAHHILEVMYVTLVLERGPVSTYTLLCQSVRLTSPSPDERAKPTIWP